MSDLRRVSYQRFHCNSLQEVKGTKNEISLWCQPVGILLSVFVPLATDATTAAIKLKNLLAVKVSEDTSSSRKPRPRKRKVTTESGNLRKKSQHARIAKTSAQFVNILLLKEKRLTGLGVTFALDGTIKIV